MNRKERRAHLQSKEALDYAVEKQAQAERDAEAARIAEEKRIEAQNLAKAARQAANREASEKLNAEIAAIGNIGNAGGTAQIVEIAGARSIHVKAAYGAAIVEKLKNDLDAKWHPESKTWKVSKLKIEQLAKLLGEAGESVEDVRLRADRDHILGTAEYKGHKYYVVGSGCTPGKGSWRKLMFKDGSKSFFASSANEVKEIKTYQSPKTLKDLRAYAAEKQANRTTAAAASVSTGYDDCDCGCHVTPRCTCPASVCPIHFDGCDRCGCENDG